MIDLAESSRHTRAHLGFWLPVGRVVAKVLLFLLGPVRVRGAYRVPRTGGLLILANHRSDCDPVIVQSACPRAIHFMAKSELFDLPVIGRIQRAFGSFPVRRGEPDRAALKQAAALLNAGEAVCVFPEGQLSEDGELQPIKGGVALIARLAPSAQLICCGLRGTERIIPYRKILPRPAFGYVDVTWGEPRSFDKSSASAEVLGWIEGQLQTLE